MDSVIQLMRPYTCFVCGTHAAFGFTTRTGDIWTCLDHRSEGDKRLVAPNMAGPIASIPTGGQ